MIVIESITIRYFRSVYTVNLKECKDLTVIAGKNDVGKSNILKALNLFFNQQTDYMNSFSFQDDYSITRKEEVRRDTVRGQQFISIEVQFVRGNRMVNSLPPKFSVTKRWDMHSNEAKTTTDVYRRMIRYAQEKGIKYNEKTTTTQLSTFLNRIKYVYIPAIKDDRVFSGTLDILQQSLFSASHSAILDEPISKANEAVQLIIADLQDDFEKATGIKNQVALPTTLNYTNGLLQINTQVDYGSITIDKRGDGIRTHYLPKILNYVANNSKNIHIWGFEEPENSYEYRRCIQVANEFDHEYSVNSQIFITSHSPAFFTEKENKLIVHVTSQDGKTSLGHSYMSLEEELGYIELYRKFIERVKELEIQEAELSSRAEDLNNQIAQMTTPLILTEGKTDSQLIKTALTRLKLEQFSNYEIQPIQSCGTSNNTTLLRYLQDLSNNSHPANLVIGIFDRDTKLEITINGQNIDIRNEPYVRIAHNIYAFALPIPHSRPQGDQISIEHYFTDDEICTEYEGKRLFLGNEFYDTGCIISDADRYFKGARNVAGTIKIIEHSQKEYVTKRDGTCNFSLSKGIFANLVEQGSAPFDTFSFEEFQKIFMIIDQITTDNCSNE